MVDLRGVTSRVIRQRVASDTDPAAPRRGLGLGLAWSGAVGWGARRRVPAPLRAPAYRAFARWVGASLDEVELPLADYACFGDFFARRLRPGARPIAAEPGDWIAPCDGVLADAGALDGDPLTAKGRGFSLAALVADAELARALAGGSFATFYLSPRDYHRVHAPVDLELGGYRYVPGSLFPVHPFFAERVDDIFAVNERLVLSARAAAGPVALVFVGAAGVGNIVLSTPKVESRHFRGGAAHSEMLSPPIEVARGDELGAFTLGSTVIVCAGPGVMPLDPALELGSALRVGDRIARGGDEERP